MDTLLEVERTIKEATDKGKMVVAVSLDVCNAFNSLPWVCIMEALRKRGFPDYLRKIIDTYRKGKPTGTVKG